jgi:hypothetical protein
MYVIPLVFPKFSRLLADVPTRKKVFHHSHVASRQYLALPHWPLFRAEKKGDPELEIAGVWPRRALRPIPALRRLGKHASLKHRWVTEVEPSP